MSRCCMLGAWFGPLTPPESIPTQPTIDTLYPADLNGDEELNFHVSEGQYWLTRARRLRFSAEIISAGLDVASPHTIKFTADATEAKTDERYIVRNGHRIFVSYGEQLPDTGGNPLFMYFEFSMCNGKDGAGPFGRVYRYSGEDRFAYGWCPLPNIVLRYGFNDGLGIQGVTLVNRFLPFYPKPENPVRSGFYFNMTGRDALTGTLYEHNFPLWRQAGDSEAQLVTGANQMQMTPVEFWPYEDENGVALYDATTGAKISAA